MNLSELLNMGIIASVGGDGGLLLDAPKGALSAALLDRIRHAKPELLAELLAGRELGEHGELGSICTNPAGKGDTLPVISERKTETEHQQAVERDAPEIMGGLLDLFAQTLARLHEVHISPADRPRMADFAQLGEAMHRAMGGTPGDWLAQYVMHRGDAIRRTVDSSPVAQACIELVESGGKYNGTVKGLLELLNTRTTASNIERGDYWPRSPKGMGDALRRAAPALRQIGVHLSVESKPRRDGVHCELRAGGVVPFPHGFIHREPSSPSSQPSHDREVIRV